MVSVGLIEWQDPSNAQQGYIFLEQHTTHSPVPFTLSSASCSHQLQKQCPLSPCPGTEQAVVWCTYTPSLLVAHSLYYWRSAICTAFLSQHPRDKKPSHQAESASPASALYRVKLGLVYYFPISILETWTQRTHSNRRFENILQDEICPQVDKLMHTCACACPCIYDQLSTLFWVAQNIHL